MYSLKKGLRGGISVTHRKGEANNKYLETFDKTKKPKYITYLDTNNLNGFGMSQYLL